MLVLEAGDSLFGKPAADRTAGALPIEAMNTMGYDAMALGELDLGAEASTLADRLEAATFAVLSANLQTSGALPVQPYLLRSLDGHTVAVIGVTATAAEKRAERLGVPIEVAAPLEAVQAAVGAVHDQADIIVLLSNLRMPTNQEIARSVEGIDVIIGSREGAPGRPQQIQGPEGPVVLQAAGRQGQMLGLLRVQFDPQGRVVDFSGRALLLTGSYREDPEIVELLRTYGVEP